MMRQRILSVYNKDKRRRKEKIEARLETGEYKKLLVVALLA